MVVGLFNDVVDGEEHDGIGEIEFQTEGRLEKVGGEIVVEIERDGSEGLIAKRTVAGRAEDGDAKEAVLHQRG